MRIAEDLLIGETVWVISEIENPCAVNIYSKSIDFGKCVIDHLPEDVKTRLQLKSRPSVASSVRGDNPDVFVFVDPMEMSVDFLWLFLIPVAQIGKDCHFVVHKNQVLEKNEGDTTINLNALRGFPNFTFHVIE